MESISTVLAILLGAGGAGGIGSLVAVFRSMRKGKLEDEETLIKRLDSSNKEHSKRADEAEAEAARYRSDRDKALEYAARLRRQLISEGLEPLPEPEELK